MGELCAAGRRGADDGGRRARAWTPNGAAERGCGPRTARPRGSPALVDPPQISRPPMPNLLAPRLPLPTTTVFSTSDNAAGARAQGRGLRAGGGGRRQWLGKKGKKKKLTCGAHK